MARFMQCTWVLMLFMLLTGILLCMVMSEGKPISCDSSNPLCIAAEGGDENPNTWLARGELAREEGDLSQAEEAFRMALQKHPHDPNVLNNLGLVLLDQGRYDEAILPFQEAVSKKPYAAPFYLNLGTAYALYGDFPQAAGYFEKATQISPKYLLALHNLGLAQLNALEFEKAVPPLLTALEIDPKNAVIWLNLGIALSQLGYQNEAIVAMEHACTLPLSDADRTLAEEALFYARQTLQETAPEQNIDPTIQEQIYARSLAPATIQPAMILPSLHPPKDESDMISLLFRFSFQGKEEMIELDVHRDLYLQAQGNYKAPLWNDPAAAEAAPAGILYHAFIHDPMQKPIIKDLAAELHRVMESHPNSSYLEVIAAFVYSFAPDTIHTELRYPIESLVDKAADCDDRTILAAALLLEDEYDVSIMTFPTHVVLGVRPHEWDMPLFEYRDSGYSVIDLASYGALGTLDPIYDAYPLSVIPINNI